MSTDQEKRMREDIVSEALWQLRAKKIQATRLVWLRADHIPEDARHGDGLVHVGASFLAAHKCQVCALGALFVGTVLRGAQPTLTCVQTRVYTNQWDAVEATQLWNDLHRYFEPHQLALIEYAFEGKDAAYPRYTLSKEEKDQARVYRNLFLRPSERLVAILENMISHGGEFCPDPPEVVNLHARAAREKRG